MECSIDEYRGKLATFVREKRQKLKLTQRGLADKAGVSERTINNIETQNYTDLTFLTVKKVCRALGGKANLIFNQGTTVGIPEPLKIQIRNRCEALEVTEQDAALTAWLNWLQITGDKNGRV